MGVFVTMGTLRKVHKEFWVAVIMVIYTVAMITPAAAEQLYQANCRAALGMQTGAIPDDAISASSSYDASSVGPQNGRIRTERNGGAWCPKQQIRQEVYEWIEVDLRKISMISLVETQGRFGNGQGQEFAESYVIDYQRVEGGPWKRFHDRRGSEVFLGNSNTYIAELREVNPPIIARRIRIVPHSSHPRTICMRVEIYGCDWKDGSISYSMPQGERRGSEVDLYDFTYDGTVKDSYLSGGLGQLVDTEEGTSNFRLDPLGIGMKGYEWIGWKNDTFDRPPVEIFFEFDKVFNFTTVRIHTNNMFSKDVRVFRKAQLFFSVGGTYYQETPVVYEYMRDTLMEYARNVIISVPHYVARFVKIQLFFDARWMMISEVRFDTVPVTGNVTEEPPSKHPSQTTPFSSGGANGRGRLPEVDVPLPGTGGDQTTTKKGSNTLVNESGEKALDDQYIGIIIGALAALILILVAIVLVCVIRHRKNKYNNNHVKSVETAHHVTLNLNDLRAMNAPTPNAPNGKISNGNLYNSIATSDVDSEQSLTITNGKVANGDLYREPFDGIQGRQLPDLPALKTPDSTTDTCTSREYAVPDLTKSRPVPAAQGSGLQAAMGFEPNIYREESPPPPPLPPHPRTMYGGLEAVPMQGLTGNSLYAVPNNMDLLWKDELSVIEFPRDKLQFVEKLGEGQFGEVHLCEAVRVADFLGDDFLVNRTTGNRSMMVAVKILRHNADEQARADFQKEVKVMSRLKDPNIVRVMGVCTVGEPLCMVVEYMKYGDLNQFLRQHIVMESTMGRRKNTKALSYGCLVYMATQMASGMKYLETLNMVHRDLATRNCLVGNFYTIKISDFGMSRSLYQSDYYRIEGRAVLPIRWMAWESVLLGKFSTKSDVWSFAVTLWEVLAMCREQPYNHLTDEQVIDNCGHYYRADGLAEVLPPPQNSPKEIYDLMCECWNREEVHRPAFREIHMFLQRKNMGYNPRDDYRISSRDEQRQTPSRIQVPIV